MIMSWLPSLGFYLLINVTLSSIAFHFAITIDELSCTKYSILVLFIFLLEFLKVSFNMHSQAVRSVLFNINAASKQVLYTCPSFDMLLQFYSIFLNFAKGTLLAVSVTRFLHALPYLPLWEEYCLFYMF